MAKVERSPLAKLTADARKIDAQLGRLIKDLSAICSGDATELETWPRIRDIRQQIEAGFAAAMSALNDSESKLSAQFDTAVDAFPRQLLEALKDAGFSIGGDSNHPILDGIVFVRMMPREASVWVNDRQVPDCRISSVVRTVSELHRQLVDQAVTPERFAAEMQTAYDEEIRSLGALAGAQVHLDALHLRVFWMRQSKAFRKNPTNEHFHAYPREQFRVDLYRLLVSGVSAPDGRAVHVASGADQAGAVFMLVPSLGRSGYVGRFWLSDSR